MSFRHGRGSIRTLAVALTLAALGIGSGLPAAPNVFAQTLPVGPLPNPTLPTGPIPNPTVPPVPLPTSPVPLPNPNPTVNPPSGGVTTPPPVVVTVQPTVGTSNGGGTVGGASTVSVCGPVTSYVTPTSANTGSITVGGQSFALAPGSSLSGGGVTVGSNLCTDLTMNAAGQVQNGSITANGAAALHICGPVSAVTSPTNANSGSAVIGGQTVQLAPGATLSGGQLTSGSTLCLDGSTNPQGQISNGSISASAPTNLNLCGVISGYTAPTNANAGSLTVGSQTVQLAPGTTFSGASLTTGNNLCGNFTTNPQGQVSGGNITASAPTSLNLCGIVSAFSPPSTAGVGSVSIGGQTVQLAPGSTFSGAGFTAGSNLCAVLTTNPNGQATGGTVSLAAPTALNLCGVVNGFTSPTSANTGSITIGGQTLQIAPGATLAGAGVTTGSNLCGAFTTNPQGQVSGGTITASAPTSLTLCGLVNGFTSPTSANTGSISIGGQTVAIAPGATLQGAAATVGGNFCLNGYTNPQGQVSNGTVSVSAPTGLSICGLVNGFTSPTSANTGSINIGGQTLVLAPGATLQGAAAQVGSNLCGTFTTNPQGQVSGGNITASAPTSLNICGVIGAFTAPTSANAGNITIGGQTFSIAPGTTLQGAAAQIGSTLCGQFNTNPQGQVNNGSITASVPVDATICGLVSAFTPPTTAVPGSMTVSGNTLVLPAGSTPPAGILVGVNTCVQQSGGGVTGIGVPPNTSHQPGSGPGGSVGGVGAGTGSGSGTGTGPGIGLPGSGTVSTAIGAAPSSSPNSNLVEYQLPKGAGPFHFAWDHSGNLWFTEYKRGRLAEIDMAARSFREYKLSSATSKPHGLTIDKNNNIWVAESGGNRVDRLTVSGATATLKMWKMPLANSRPVEVAVANGKVWITEEAGRLAMLTPKSNRFDEYSSTLLQGPHSIKLASGGALFTDEHAQTLVSIQIMSGNAMRWIAADMPSHNAAPAHVEMTSNGAFVSEYGANGIALLKMHPAAQIQPSLTGHARSQLVRPTTHTLAPISVKRTPVVSGLPEYDFTVTPKNSTMKVKQGLYFQEWKLPQKDSQPYDLRYDQARQGLWMSEDSGNRVALMTPSTSKISEYTLPQANSHPKGIEIRKIDGTTQVWIAAFAQDRLAVLTVPNK